MPKLSKKLPSYCRHKATGRPYVNISRRDIYLGPYGTAASKREYERVVREHFATGGVDQSGEALTVVELLAGFNRFAQKHYGAKSKATLNYRTLIARLRKASGPPEQDFIAVDAGHAGGKLSTIVPVRRTSLGRIVIERPAKVQR